MNIRSEAQRIKPSVIERHDSQCYICGFSCKPVLIMHHIVPVGVGGNNDLSNVVSLCPNCHAIVHKMMPMSKSFWDSAELGIDGLSRDQQHIWEWICSLPTAKSDRFMPIVRMEMLEQEQDNEYVD